MKSEISIKIGMMVPGAGIEPARHLVPRDFKSFGTLNYKFNNFNKYAEIIIFFYCLRCWEMLGFFRKK